MRKFRIIPRLDIKGPNLVKGIHLEGLRVLGDPASFAKLYYQEGADEIFYQDVVASLYGRSSLHDIISKTAKEAFIPLTVGGGIRTINNISDVLKAGADKVCINSAAVRDPEFIKKASEKFGKSTIVVAIEAIKQSDGKYFAFTDNAREETGLEVVAWAKKVVELGAGEIVITSVDQEGTGKGIDQKLVASIISNVDIPVIVHGGLGNLHHIKECYNLGASGVAVASLFHYEALERGLIEVPSNSSEGNTRFLERKTTTGRIKGMSIQDLKKSLNYEGVPVRGLL